MSNYLIFSTNFWPLTRPLITTNHHFLILRQPYFPTFPVPFLTFLHFENPSPRFSHLASASVAPRDLRFWDHRTLYRSSAPFCFFESACRTIWKVGLTLLTKHRSSHTTPRTIWVISRDDSVECASLFKHTLISTLPYRKGFGNKCFLGFEKPYIIPQSNTLNFPLPPHVMVIWTVDVKAQEL